jgi:hypothetical protein
MKKDDLYNVLQELYEASDKIDTLYSKYVVASGSRCYSTLGEMQQALCNINDLSDNEYYKIKLVFEQVRIILKNR